MPRRDAPPSSAAPRVRDACRCLHAQRAGRALARRFDQTLRPRAMGYVDGLVLAVPRRDLAAYRRMARPAARIWRQHGALEFRECAGDDLDTGMDVSFARLVRLKRGKTVVFSWIAFRSRADRDRVNAKVMNDPRLARMMKGRMPFDPRRMA